MLGRKINLFKLFGFTVSVDFSWLIIAFLIVWSLAVGLFPFYYPGLSSGAYWFMGLAGAVGLFLSIIFHEFWHSLIARRYGLPMHGITLFVFGGVSEMAEEPPSAKVEFLMAIAGPLSSFALAIFFYLIVSFIGGNWPLPVRSVLVYLAFINSLLGIFNLLPGFPLDGGRILRSALWAWKGNLKWATRIASWVGSAFGLGLIFLGALSFLSGNIIGGIWWFLIGMFLRNAAQGSYRQLLIKRALEGEHVERFMKRDPVTVSPDTSVADLVDGYIYKHHFKMYPVLDRGSLLGVVSTRQVKEMPREEWDRHVVKEITAACQDDNTIPPEADATQALEKMNKSGNSRLLVTDKSKLVGIITLKDLLKFLSIKLDFDVGEGAGV